MLLSLDEGGDRFLSLNFGVLRIVRFFVDFTIFFKFILNGSRLLLLYTLYPFSLCLTVFLQLLSWRSSWCKYVTYTSRPPSPFVKCKLTICWLLSHRVLRTSINFIRYLYLTDSVKFKENWRFRTGIYGNSFLEANLLLWNVQTNLWQIKLTYFVLLLSKTAIARTPFWLQTSANFTHLERSRTYGR